MDSKRKVNVMFMLYLCNYLEVETQLLRLQPPAALAAAADAGVGVCAHACGHECARDTQD